MNSSVYKTYVLTGKCKKLLDLLQGFYGKFLTLSRTIVLDRDVFLINVFIKA